MSCSTAIQLTAKQSNRMSAVMSELIISLHNAPSPVSTVKSNELL